MRPQTVLRYGGNRGQTGGRPVHPAVTLTLGMAGMQHSGGLRRLGLVPAHLTPPDMAHAQGFTRSPGPCASVRRCGRTQRRRLFGHRAEWPIPMIWDEGADDG